MLVLLILIASVPVPDLHLSELLRADNLASAIQRRSRLGRGASVRIARLIKAQAKRRGIDPFLIAGLIHRESRWDRRLASKKNHGLMQVRVSRTTNTGYTGRESLLYQPRRNIRIGVRMLARWRKYHQRKCTGRRAHYWWAHYQWGSRPGNNGSASRVLREYLGYINAGR